jgi:hypothetical protein
MVQCNPMNPSSADGNLAAGDRTNIAFAGTAITYG